MEVFFHRQPGVSGGMVTVESSSLLAASPPAVQGTSAVDVAAAELRLFIQEKPRLMDIDPGAPAAMKPDPSVSDDAGDAPLWASYLLTKVA